MSNQKVAKGKSKNGGGFTLIEVLVVIAIIAILAAIVLVAINPAKRFQDARNSQRKANVEAVLSALQQNMVDNKGILTGCPTLPSTAATAADMTSTVAAGNVDVASCVAAYLASQGFADVRVAAISAGIEDSFIALMSAAA